MGSGDQFGLVPCQQAGHVAAIAASIQSGLFERAFVDVGRSRGKAQSGLLQQGFARGAL